MNEPTKEQGLRRQHSLLIWDNDWQFAQQHRLTGGYIFRKGIEFIQNPPQIQEEWTRKMAFLQGKLEEKSIRIEELEAKYEPKQTI